MIIKNIIKHKYLFILVIATLGGVIGTIYYMNSTTILNKNIEVVNDNYSQRLNSYWLSSSSASVSASISSESEYLKQDSGDVWKSVDIKDKSKLELYWRTKEYLNWINSNDQNEIVDEIFHYLKNDELSGKILTRKPEDIAYNTSNATFFSDTFLFLSKLNNFKYYMQSNGNGDDLIGIKTIIFAGDVVCTGGKRLEIIDPKVLLANGKNNQLYEISSGGYFGYGSSDEAYRKTLGWNEKNAIGVIGKIKGEDKFKFISGDFYIPYSNNSVMTLSTTCK